MREKISEEKKKAGKNKNKRIASFHISPSTTSLESMCIRRKRGSKYITDRYRQIQTEGAGHGIVCSVYLAASLSLSLLLYSLQFKPSSCRHFSRTA